MKTALTNLVSIMALLSAFHCRTSLHRDAVSEGTKSVAESYSPRIAHPVEGFAVPESNTAPRMPKLPPVRVHAKPGHVPQWTCAPRLLQGIPGGPGRPEYGMVEECGWS